MSRSRNASDMARWQKEATVGPEILGEMLRVILGGYSV